MREATRGLSNLRVVDASERLSSSFCARLFGDFGADVVLLERNPGHPIRLAPPFVDSTGIPDSLLHVYANFNKRSVLVDSLHDDIAQRLIAWADVLVVSSRADAELVKARAKHAVVVVVTPAGLTGPLAEAPSTELTQYANSGWAGLNGLEGHPPLKGISNQVGYLAGLTAFVGALAAQLYQSKPHGEGQLVDVSELESLATIAGPTILSALYDGKARQRPRGDVFDGPVPAQDGFVSLTFSRSHFWRDAMTVLELPELIDDPRALSPASRRLHRDRLAPMIEEQVRDKNRWEVFELLSMVRCVSGVVLDMADLDQNVHLAERSFFIEAGASSGAGIRLPGAPVKLSKSPWSYRRPAPTLGQHTAELTEELSRSTAGCRE